MRADRGARANALKDELGEEGAAAALLDKEGIKDFKFHATVQSRTAAGHGRRAPGAAPGGGRRSGGAGTAAGVAPAG